MHYLQKKVHAIEPCSKQYNDDDDDEGYGQRGIYVPCFEAGSIRGILQLWEYDNWKNQGKENEKLDQKRIL